MNISLPRRDERGFTLIELLVVIIIIGILAAIAIPLFLDQRKLAVDAQVKADVRNTLANIQTWQANGNANKAEANTGAYLADGGKTAQSSYTSLGVSIDATGKASICGYAAGKGKVFTGESAAFVYSADTGQFTTGSCTTGATTGGATKADGSAPTAPVVVASYDFSNGLQGWYASSGSTVSAVTQGGKNALYFTGGTMYMYPGAQVYTASNAFTVGKSYTMTADVWLNNGAYMYIAPASQYSVGTNGTNVKGSWVSVSTTFTADSPQGNPAVIINPSSGNTGDGYIANVKFTAN